MDRRGFLTGLISLVAAPAIVRATSLMPIKALEAEYGLGPMITAMNVQRRLDELKIMRSIWRVHWNDVAMEIYPHAP